MFCPRCGKKLAGTEKFCLNCGFDLAMPSSSAAEGARSASDLPGRRPYAAQGDRAAHAPVTRHAPTAVAPSGLVTLAAALLTCIAAFLPFLVISGSSYDYSVALADAVDGVILVLLAIAMAVLPVLGRTVASLLLSSLTTAFALFEVCSVSLMLLSSPLSTHYVTYGAGFCLLALGAAMGVLSIVLLARDVMRGRRGGCERQGIMGSFIPTSGRAPHQR